MTNVTDKNNAFSEFERSGWNSTASVYDSHFGKHTAKYCSALLDATNISSGFKVLDMACGPGYVSAAATQREAIVLGIDFAPNMIAEAKAKHPSINFQTDNAEQLSLADNTFDAVVMGFGMLHLAQPEAAALEANRVLVPEGRFGFSVWGVPENVCIGTGIILRAMQDHANMDLDLPEGPPMFRFADRDESTHLLDQAGFINIEVQLVEQAWLLENATDLLDTFQEAGVRAGAVLRAQSAEVMQKIREQVVADAAPYRKNDKYEFPMGAVITSGQKRR